MLPVPVVLSVSVESAMECKMACQMTCFCAVSFSGTPSLRRRLRQAQRGRDLLVAHPRDCHFFGGKESLCGKDRFARRMLANTWDLSQMWLWCMCCHLRGCLVDVKCANLLFYHKLCGGEEGEKLMYILGSPSPYYN